MKFFLMLCIVFLHGCVSQYPSDLRVVSIEPIENNKEGTEQSNQKGSVLKITLKSKEDIFYFAKEKSLIVRDVMVFCEYPDRDFLMIDSGIKDVTNSMDDEFNYYSFSIRTLWNRKVEIPYSLRKEKSNIYYESYDYQFGGDDVCYRVVGGDMLGRSFESNFVRIKGQDIKGVVVN